METKSPQIPRADDIISTVNGKVHQFLVDFEDAYHKLGSWGEFTVCGGVHPKMALEAIERLMAAHGMIVHIEGKTAWVEERDPKAEPVVLSNPRHEALYQKTGCPQSYREFYDAVMKRQQMRDHEMNLRKFRELFATAINSDNWDSIKIPSPVPAEILEELTRAGWKAEPVENNPWTYRVSIA